MTATATARVRDEIVERLRMRRPSISVRGFDRPNLYLRVDHFKTESEKLDGLVHRVRWSDKPGIVYTSTRKAAEQVMQALAAEQVDALYYHGGMKAKERHEIQEKFMGGESEVMVATNAFGMGVDKADIRFRLPLRSRGLARFVLPGDWARRAGREGGGCDSFLSQGRPPRAKL